MTINLSDNSPRISYSVANGVTQTSFTVPFEFFDDDDLNVYVDGTLKTLTTDYTTTGGDGSTGTVVISVTGASGGSTVVITRDIDIERTTDFPTSGPFQIAALNTELDRITAIAADLDDRAARALQLTDYDVAAGLTLPELDNRKGTVLAFNSSTGAVEAGPTTTNVNQLADITDDIATLADIEDGTDATDAIQTVAGISGNVTTVAGVSANVTTVAGISANVTTVAGISANTTTVAGISSDVTTVAGISSDVTTVAGDAADIATVAGDSADIQSLAAVSTQIGLLGTADAIADMNTLATSAIVTDLDALADLATEIDALGDVTSDITTVSGISANVTTVAGVSANVTTVAGISSNVTTVAGVSSDVTTVAGISANVTTVAGDTANIGTIATNLNGTDTIGTVAGSISNVNSVGGSIANVNTVATNLSGVNSFAERYRVGATDPTTSLDEGDLFFNTTSNAYKFYDGSQWNTVNVSGIGSVADDSSPQLGGNLDLNSNNITGTGDISVTGDLTIDTNVLHVDSTNNRVGVGTSSPATAFHVNGQSTTKTIVIKTFDTNVSTGFLGGRRDWTGVAGTDNNFAVAAYEPNMCFFTNGSGTERMRIDSSGNLLVGTTVTPVNLLTATSGGGMGFDPTDNYLVVAREGTNSSKPVIRLNQTGVDGSIAEFRKDGTTVASIDTHGGVIQFGQGNVNLAFENGADVIYPANDNGTNNDGDIDLGTSSARFKDLYLGGGVVENTTTVTYASSIALTYNNGSIQTVTLTGNVTFTDSLADGEAIVLMLNAGASHTVTWTAVDKWVSSGGNAAPTLTANDTLVFWKIGSTVYGAYVGSYT